MDGWMDGWMSLQESPGLGSIVAKLAEALLIEPICLGHLSALMIPPQQEDVMGAENLEAQQQHHGLHSMIASVNIVP